MPLLQDHCTYRTQRTKAVRLGWAKGVQYDHILPIDQAQEARIPLIETGRYCVGHYLFPLLASNLLTEFPDYTSIMTLLKEHGRQYDIVVFGATGELRRYER